MAVSVPMPLTTRDQQEQAVRLAWCGVALHFRPHQLHQMRDGRNAFALPDGGGAEQRAGGDKQHVAQPAALQIGQDFGAEHRRRTAAAGTARMDVLSFAVINQQAAVVVPRADIHALFFQQVNQQCAAHRAEIARKNRVIRIRRGLRVRQKPQDGLRRCRSDCQGFAKMSLVLHKKLLVFLCT